MNEKLKSKLTSLDDLINHQYDELGSSKRDKFEEGFTAFKIEQIKNFEDLIEFEHGKIGFESRIKYEKNANLFINNEMIKVAKSTKK